VFKPVKTILAGGDNRIFEYSNPRGLHAGCRKHVPSVFPLPVQPAWRFHHKEFLGALLALEKDTKHLDVRLTSKKLISSS